MKIDAEMKRVFTAAYKQGVRDALGRGRYIINSYIDPKIRRKERQANNLGCCDEYALDQFELCREEIYELEADLLGKG